MTIISFYWMVLGWHRHGAQFDSEPDEFEYVIGEDYDSALRRGLQAIGSGPKHDPCVEIQVIQLWPFHQVIQRKPVLQTWGSYPSHQHIRDFRAAHPGKDFLGRPMKGSL